MISGKRKSEVIENEKPLVKKLGLSKSVDDETLSSSSCDEALDEGTTIEEVKATKIATIMKIFLASPDDTSGQNILSKANTKKESKEEIETTSKKKSKKRFQKKDWLNVGKSCPNIIADNEKERKLRIIATQGVVQLFSTLESHKRQVKQTLVGRKTQHQKIKALSEQGEESFLKLLEREGNKIQNSLAVKEELKAERAPVKSGWNVLAKNFYEESSLSNWDKVDSDEG